MIFVAATAINAGVVVDRIEVKPFGKINNSTIIITHYVVSNENVVVNKRF